MSSNLDIDLRAGSEIDYKRIDDIVNDSLKMFPDMDKFVLWVMACDYYIQEELKKDIEIKPEYEDIYQKCKDEYNTTKVYDAINVIAQ